MPAPDLQTSTAYAGRSFVYMLRMAGAEDLLKVGMSHDPLRRFSAFHARWFEAFDLDHSLLLETETRRDARRLETRLHRLLAEHHCPPPMSFRPFAGGGSEWYRGAEAATRAFALAQQQAGHVLHMQARTWLAKAMREQQAVVFELLQSALAEHHAGWLLPQRRQALRDLLDAHRAFDAQLDARLPLAALEELGWGA